MTQLRYFTPSPKRHLLPTLAVVSLLAAQPAFADNDPLVKGALLCTQHFQAEEKKNGIPANLLAAIATTESGRFDKDLGMAIPWPWTINVDGKGYYFESKAEAIAQVQNLRSRGHESIDVGCMQVNLKYHPNAFANLSEAFEPATNVAYAAKFLHDNYATYNDWIKATAAYHSVTPIYGQQYLVEIEQSWNRIVAKVAEARAKVAGSDQTSAALGAPTQSAPMPKVVQPLPRIVSGQPSMQAAHHAHIIQVSDDATRRSSAVMVTHPPEAAMQPPAQALAQAQASVPQPAAAATPAAPVAAAPAAVANIPAPAGDSLRRVSLDNTTGAVLPSGQQASPKFVFAN
jgi:hypothetical protein